MGIFIAKSSECKADKLVKEKFFGIIMFRTLEKAINSAAKLKASAGRGTMT